MKRTLHTVAAGVAIAVASVGSAAAESLASDRLERKPSINLFTSINVNLRAGPGTRFDKRGVIPAGQIVTINGCLEGYRWCDVEWLGQRGWIYARTLTRPGLGKLFASYAEGVGIPVISHDPAVTARPAAAAPADGAALTLVPNAGVRRNTTGPMSFAVKDNSDLMGGDIGLPKGFGR